MTSSNSTDSFQRKIKDLSMRVEQVKLNSKEYEEKEKIFFNTLRLKSGFSQKKLQDSCLSFEEEINRLTQNTTELIDVYRDLLEVVCSHEKILSKEDKTFIESISPYFFTYFIFVEQPLSTVFGSILPDSFGNSIEEVESKIWRKFRDFPQSIRYSNDPKIREFFNSDHPNVQEFLDLVHDSSMNGDTQKFFDLINEGNLIKDSINKEDKKK